MLSNCRQRHGGLLTLNHGFVISDNDILVFISENMETIHPFLVLYEFIMESIYIYLSHETLKTYLHVYNEKLTSKIESLFSIKGSCNSSCFLLYEIGGITHGSGF